MRIDILTLFPDTVGDMMNESILGRAQERGYIRIEAHQIRDYTANKQNQVDDYPYGGGRGALMQAAPLYRCWCHVCDEGRAVLLAQNHIAALGSQSNFNGIGQLVNAGLQLLAGFFAVNNHLGHDNLPP